VPYSYTTGGINKALTSMVVSSEDLKSIEKLNEKKDLDNLKWRDFDEI
jgi:hypothetical protein